MWPRKIIQINIHHLMVAWHFISNCKYHFCTRSCSRKAVFSKVCSSCPTFPKIYGFLQIAKRPDSVYYPHFPCPVGWTPQPVFANCSPCPFSLFLSPPNHIIWLCERFRNRPVLQDVVLVSYQCCAPYTATSFATPSYLVRARSRHVEDRESLLLRYSGWPWG